MPAGSLPRRSLRILLVLIGFILLLANGHAAARCFGVPEDRDLFVLWSVSVVATSESGDTDSGTFGIAPGATNLYEAGLDIFEPPPDGETRLRLFFFLEQVLKFPPAKFDQSYIAPSDFMDWVMKVEYRGTDPVQITLTWDVQEVLEASEPFYLRMIDGATSIDMLSTSSYVYEATPGTRAFKVVAEPREESSGGLFVVLIAIGYGGVFALFMYFRRRRKKSLKEAQSLRSPASLGGPFLRSLRPWLILLTLLTLLPTASAHHVDPFEVIKVLERNEIPAVYDPQFTREDYLEPEDEVIGLTLGGEARAYPISIMNWHEVVNDLVADVPVAITYCPLCGTGIVFSRMVDGEELTLGVSGRLYKSNLVMFDNETESLWSQITGEAIQGRLHGKKLEWISSSTLPSSEWRFRHPDSRILLPPLPQCAGGRTGNSCRDYTADPYAGYRRSTVVYGDFGGEYTDRILHPKAMVLGIQMGGVAVAYPYSLLEELGIVHDVLNRQPVLVTYVNGSAQAFDPGGRQFASLRDGFMKDSSGEVWRTLTGESPSGDKLRQLEATPSMWFSWAQFYPGSGVHGMRPPSVLSFSLRTSPPEATRVEVLIQEVWLNNTSDFSLDKVMVTVELPEALDYITDDAATQFDDLDRSVEGSGLAYRLPSLSPGFHSFRITTSLVQGDLPGIIFKGTISIQYEDADGRIIEASRQGETFRVVERSSGPTPLFYIVPLMVIPALGWWIIRRMRAS